MDVEIIKTNIPNEDFDKLIKLLEEDLKERYGELQQQYEKHNKVDVVRDVVIIYENKVPVACGALKEYDSNTIELKRIYVMKEYRKQGLAKSVVKELEEAGINKGYKYAILETGIKQQEAINLYRNSGYTIIQNYGPYLANENSVCMKKPLLKGSKI